MHLKYINAICTGPNKNGKAVSFANDNGIDVDEYPGQFSKTQLDFPWNLFFYFILFDTCDHRVKGYNRGAVHSSLL